jgi:hypothetical protein
VTETQELVEMNEVPEELTAARALVAREEAEEDESDDSDEEEVDSDGFLGGEESDGDDGLQEQDDP